MGRVFLFVSRSVSNHALAFPLARLLVKTNPTLSRHQLTFYHSLLTETNNVAWLVEAP